MFDSSHNGAAATSKLASHTNGSIPKESEHFVQFYETNVWSCYSKLTGMKST